MPSNPPDKSQDQVEFLGEVDLFDEPPHDSFQDLERVEGKWHFAPPEGLSTWKMVGVIVLVGAAALLAAALL